MFRTHWTLITKQRKWKDESHQAYAAFGAKKHATWQNTPTSQSQSLWTVCRARARLRYGNHESYTEGHRKVSIRAEDMERTMHRVRYPAKSDQRCQCDKENVGMGGAFENERQGLDKAITWVETQSWHQRAWQTAALDGRRPTTWRSGLDNGHEITKSRSRGKRPISKVDKKTAMMIIEHRRYPCNARVSYFGAL